MNKVIKTLLTAASGIALSFGLVTVSIYAVSKTAEVEVYDDI